MLVIIHFVNINSLIMILESSLQNKLLINANYDHLLKDKLLIDVCVWEFVCFSIGCNKDLTSIKYNVISTVKKIMQYVI